MCNPAAIIGVAQGASSFIGARNAAKAQEEAQRRASLAENERLRSEQLSLRQQQAQTAVGRGQRKVSAEIAAREARAKARLAAGHAGISGLSVDAVINNLTRKEGAYISSEDMRAEMQDTALALQLEQGVIASHQNQLRINRPVPQASLLEAGLDGAMTGLNAANIMSRFTA